MIRGLVVALTAFVSLWLLAIGGLVLVGKPAAAREIATLLPNLIALFRGLRKEPGVSRFDKMLIVIAVVWIASPIDLIPEFIPVLGPLDDALVAALVLRRLVRAAGTDAVKRHWRGSEESLRVILRVAGVKAA